ncbi:MAG: hypothetical protein J0G30_11320 [Actinomycetales bacterium]|nr:hypothetical protein [Actinomycetales bacterium]
MPSLSPTPSDSDPAEHREPVSPGSTAVRPGTGGADPWVPAEIRPRVQRSPAARAYLGYPVGGARLD